MNLKTKVKGTLINVSKELSKMGQPYEIVSVKKADPPPGVEGSDWYRYEIAQGSNIIHGCRAGSLRGVTMAVEEMVDQLNERRLGKRGRVNLVPTPKRNPEKKS